MAFSKAIGQWDSLYNNHKENPIGNRNSPIMDPITEMGVANALLIIS